MSLPMRLTASFSLAIAAAASALSWKRLPARVPVHFDLHGQPNRWGSPLEALLTMPVLLLALWIFAEAQARFADRPAQADATRGEREGARSTVIALVAMLLLSVHLLLLLRAQGLLHDPVRASALVLAAFLVLLGNVIGRLRPSYLLGIRTPWTLSSGAVWRRTHRLAGWLMVPSGLVALLLDFALPSGWALPLTIGLLLASTLAPAAMSYVWAHRTAV